jgi:ABC-type uncharacterized transport system ATPase subunit
VKEFLERIEGVESVVGEDGAFRVILADVEETLYRIVREAVGSGFHIREMRPLLASLEDIFVKLTTDENVSGGDR